MSNTGKVQVSAEDARKAMALSLDGFLRTGDGLFGVTTIERALDAVSRQFGVRVGTVRNLLISKCIGLAIHENLREGIDIEEGIKKACRRFDVQPTPEQILVLTRMHHDEQERINTRLKGNEMDDGAGGTVTIENEHGTAVDKSELMKPKN